MGLLSRKDRQQLIDLLLKLPGIDNAQSRQNLIASLPRDVRQSIPAGLAAREHVVAIASALDEDGMQLADGAWLITVLIEEAIWTSPKNTRLYFDLIQFYDRVQLRQNVSAANTTPEALVLEGAGPYEIDEWIDRSRNARNTVCRLLTPSNFVGTGFLVGPDLLLTNWHVIKHDIHDPALLGLIEARFDFRKDTRNQTVTPGVSFRLRAEAPLATSPYEQLDFALLRIVGTPGSDQAADGTRRGWLSPISRPLMLGEPLMIIQHPGGKAMKIALDHLTKYETQRMHYTTNTEKGSSGSPCLDRNWNLIGLHSRGFEQDHNEGIPMSSIADRDDVRMHLPA